MPTSPFVFLGCLELRELLVFEAHDARELGETLEKVPVESVFCHMSAVLMHRSALTEAYPNDFAHWVAHEVRDARLAERLSAVDPYQSDSLDRVREELVSTIGDHLRHLSAAPSPSQGQAFRFFRQHLVPVPTGHQASTLREFRDAVAEVDASALFYHIIDGRYRPGHGRSDFVEWVDRSLGNAELAERLTHIDPGIGSLERIRDRHLRVLTDALEREGRA
jgi:hypothetical protein